MAYSKKIIILLLLFIFLFSTISSAVETVNPVEDATLDDKNISIQHDNQYNTLYMIQYSAQSRLISRIYSQMNDNYWQYRAVAEKVYNEFKTLGEHKKFMYVVEGTDGYYFDVYFGYAQDMSTDVRAIMTNAQSFTSVPCYVGTIYRVCQIQSAGIFYPDTPVNTIVSMAYADVVHPEWINLFKSFNLLPNDSDTTLKNIESATKNTENTVNNINNSVNDVNSSIKDDNVDTDNLGFATDDTVNPTSEGFDTLFNTVYNAFCTTSSEPLVITLPFVDKTFTIQPNVVSSGMQKAGLGVVVALINSFYYFAVCLFIYKDIAKIVDNLKSGNITSDCGNVKTEVL